MYQRIWHKHLWDASWLHWHVWFCCTVIPSCHNIYISLSVHTSKSFNQWITQFMFIFIPDSLVFNPRQLTCTAESFVSTGNSNCWCCDWLQSPAPTYAPASTQVIPPRAACLCSQNSSNVPFQCRTWPNMMLLLSAFIHTTFESVHNETEWLFHRENFLAQDVGHHAEC